ncbi:hypothetical protein QRD02_04065 [Aequorivita sp. SDUM287046]|uniref:DUF4136 domain-containing protein n=1 Tax=Aequorivita aurantiaca TaxID=3053356 RepID=A0ABT8DK86_9FLAO|nr:hypothetical protein [Aequorivita aurantiaca]MDN3723545.1 hypothetical protein [Aequorivita aurantiaca]
MDSWKAEPSVVDLFKKKNVLVIARTSNNDARFAFESAMADALRARGIKATESYNKAPHIHPHREMTEERLTLLKTLMKTEGLNAVLLTVVKDKQQTVRTTTDGFYTGGLYSAYYPGYYGSFYNYYSYPYAYGGYYSSFGGYIPSETTEETTYVLETVAYILDETEENQLVAVVTTRLDDPNDAHKSAKQYIDTMIKALETDK